MIPYLLLFAVPAYLALTQPPEGFYSLRLSWWPMGAVIALMVGYRFEVGGDWFNYLRNFDRILDRPLLESMLKGDPAHQLLSWISAEQGWGVYGVNLVYGLIFSVGLIYFCRFQPRPWLALTVAVPYLVIVVGMGYSRQGVAIGFAMLGLIALARNQVLYFVLAIAAAATFHKTALVMIPLAVLSATTNRVWTAVWVAVASLFLYSQLLEQHTDYFVHGYLEANYASSGAAIRVAMNAIPAILFLYYRDFFGLADTEKKLWTWMSLICLVLVVLLFVSSSSTAVDRIALYFIPVQLFVFSRLPVVLSPAPGFVNKAIEQYVILYYAAVLMVWLLFAVHARYWLPYQFYWFSG